MYQNVWFLRFCGPLKMHKKSGRLAKKKDSFTKKATCLGQRVGVMMSLASQSELQYSKSTVPLVQEETSETDAPSTSIDVHCALNIIGVWQITVVLNLAQPMDRNVHHEPPSLPA